MKVTQLVEQLQVCGVSIELDRDELVLRPGSKVPAELLAEVRQCKGEIIAFLGQEPMECETTEKGLVGDGQPPPSDRPPANETEFRRLMDHLADPVAFAAWIEWAMHYTDPAEEGTSY